MKKTPLYEKHVSLGARMIDFGGWLMPVQYTSLMDEHQAARQAAALFDICHMGEIRVTGPGAFDLLQYALTRDLAGQKNGQIKLSALLTDEGGIIDDLTVYKMGDETFLLVTNATTREADFSRVSALRDEKGFDCRIEDASDQTGKLDLQGPAAEAILQTLTDADLHNIRFYHFAETSVAGVPALVSRSGYTGEDGFEIYAAADSTGRIWDALMKAGEPRGLKPAGLGARDTLRLEAGMLLNGQDITTSVCPMEVPYAWLVAWEKDFAGRPALDERKRRGIARQLVGFEMVGRGIARHGHPVLNGSREIGVVTSGTFSPTLQKAIGLAFLDSSSAAPATPLAVRIREHEIPAKIVPLPFYKRKK
ncbi:MAG TPA: glycine cleavage system aminomethyltransferase GcvT [Smithellaceae bacterium]|nr:glycine cleavage system aminomethyltransferase GcvT [Smithellaceae bacterium]